MLFLMEMYVQYKTAHRQIHIQNYRRHGKIEMRERGNTLVGAELFKSSSVDRDWG